MSSRLKNKHFITSPVLSSALPGPDGDCVNISGVFHLFNNALGGSSRSDENVGLNSTHGLFTEGELVVVSECAC